ncbi:uncharacterized protein LOC115055016 [Echeneis naucrates]|uniref:uncharacterized protein LOC115055016 n=1 Tax=Echeneis naucrates TaxID=173247 RepID=UPI001113F9FC|nr:uncharacterized protein LOC115055016 [Echeneis naucrates]
MFRISLIVCASLIFGITAKPYKPWNKLKGDALQDTVMSIDDGGKMSWSVEVEPPEDMDETHYDVDPRMMIGKSMTGSQRAKPLKAEEDLDERHHPSLAELPNIENMEVLSAADMQSEYNEEPEGDRDDIDHPVFSEEAQLGQDWEKVDNKVREQLNIYLIPLIAEPERDEDDLYHRDEQLSPVQTELLRPEVRREHEVRVHLQPEDDMDDLYHQDLLLPIPYQGDTEVVVPVDFPSQKQHSEPEEDLDDLFHQ